MWREGVWVKGGVCENIFSLVYFIFLFSNLKRREPKPRTTYTSASKSCPSLWCRYLFFDKQLVFRFSKRFCVACVNWKQISDLLNMWIIICERKEKDENTFSYFEEKKLLSKFAYLSRHNDNSGRQRLIWRNCLKEITVPRSIWNDPGEIGNICHADLKVVLRG